MKLRRIFSRRRWRLRASRLARRPIVRLTRHFLARLVHGDQEEGSDFNLGAGALLGLLAAPGAFQTFVMINKYSTLLDFFLHHQHPDYYLRSIPDKYLFISIAMAVTGIVTVLKWDRILPDAQDYTNLAPLPIRARTILAANVGAIGIAVLLFVTVANAFSTLLFPAFVTAAAQVGLPELVRFVAIHAAVMALASLFTFYAVFTVLGIFATILPRRAFQGVSSWLRGILVVAFLMLLPSGEAAPALLRQLAEKPDSPLRWLPSFWFLGLYQSWQHKATPALEEVGRMALPVTAALFVCMVAAYALSYRRRFRAVLESTQRRSGPRSFRLVPAALDLAASRTQGFERASHRFAVRALLRNEGHRLCLAVALGLGWLLGFQSVANARGDARPSAALLEGPLIAVYLLALALRLAFEMPAVLSANWIYRSLLDPLANQSRGVARRVMLAFLVPAVLLPSAAYFWWKWGWAASLLEIACLLCLSACLTEILLSGYRKVPLTCPMPGIRQNFLVLCITQFLAFEAFTQIGAGFERWIFDRPQRFVWLPGLMLTAWAWRRQRQRQALKAGEAELGITFESAPPPDVVRLNILSGG
ncbi:MAG: hypothetical protein WCB12_12030 [Bryobacteraceae bacterium]